MSFDATGKNYFDVLTYGILKCTFIPKDRCKGDSFSNLDAVNASVHKAFPQTSRIRVRDWVVLMPRKETSLFMI